MDPEDLRLLQEALQKELNVIGRFNHNESALNDGKSEKANMEQVPIGFGRKRLQIFEQITLTKTNKRKSKKNGQKVAKVQVI